jgi:hypothetical protein
VIAVLQGWSKNTFSGRIIAMSFVVLFGAAAVWGLRTLVGWPR